MGESGFESGNADSADWRVKLIVPLSDMQCVSEPEPFFELCSNPRRRKNTLNLENLKLTKITGE